MTVRLLTMYLISTDFKAEKYFNTNTKSGNMLNSRIHILSSNSRSPALQILHSLFICWVGWVRATCCGVFCVFFTVVVKHFQFHLWLSATPAMQQSYAWTIDAYKKTKCLQKVLLKTNYFQLQPADRL